MQRRRSTRTWLLVLMVTLAGTALSLAGAQAAAPPPTPTFQLVKVDGPTYSAPIWAGAAPGSGDTIYVAEQGGRIYAQNGATRRLFLNIARTISTGGEQGLLTVAFSRDYAKSGRFFVYVTQPNGDGQIRQYRTSKGRVINGSMRVILNVPLSPPTATNHNGGNLWAGPRGLLYLSVGDGGGGGVEVQNSQRLNRLMGKLLRIAPRANGGYVIPRTNPFFTRAGARREIFAIGLRNPWRFSIDEPTGDIWIGDVGQNEREEINRLPAGAPTRANFGWPRTEGLRTFDSSVKLAPRTTYVRPVTDYTHASGGCAVTGGLVYHGSVTSLQGWYLYADYCTDTITARHVASGTTVIKPAVGGIVHFGATAGDDVVAVSVSDGHLYRIAAA